MAISLTGPMAASVHRDLVKKESINKKSSMEVRLGRTCEREQLTEMITERMKVCQKIIVIIRESSQYSFSKPIGAEQRERKGSVCSFT
jgi:hypothetical protein